MSPRGQLDTKLGTVSTDEALKNADGFLARQEVRAALADRVAFEQLNEDARKQKESAIDLFRAAENAYNLLNNAGYGDMHRGKEGSDLETINRRMEPIRLFTGEKRQTFLTRFRMVMSSPQGPEISQFHRNKPVSSDGKLQIDWLAGMRCYTHSTGRLVDPDRGRHCVRITDGLMLGITRKDGMLLDPELLERGWTTGLSDAELFAMFDLRRRAGGSPTRDKVSGMNWRVCQLYQQMKKRVSRYIDSLGQIPPGMPDPATSEQVCIVNEVGSSDIRFGLRPTFFDNPYYDDRELQSHWGQRVLPDGMSAKDIHIGPPSAPEEQQIQFRRRCCKLTDTFRPKRVGVPLTDQVRGAVDHIALAISPHARREQYERLMAMYANSTGIILDSERPPEE